MTHPFSNLFKESIRIIRIIRLIWLISIISHCPVLSQITLNCFAINYKGERGGGLEIMLKLSQAKDLYFYAIQKMVNNRQQLNKVRNPFGEQSCSFFIYFLNEIMALSIH